MVHVTALLITSDGKMTVEMDKEVEETHPNLPGQWAMSQLRIKFSIHQGKCC
jgi:hypothetical protein